jgi:outer membrane protein TolC
MDLTGTNESCARAVFMYVCPPNKTSEQTSGPLLGGQEPEETPTNGHDKVPPTGLLVILMILAVLLVRGPVTLAADSRVGTNTFVTQPLSLADAVNIAMQQNPNILRARQDLEAAQGIVIQTRAIAIPKLTTTGNYSVVQGSDVDTPPLPFTNAFGVIFGVPQNWSTQVRLVQSIYEGGRISSSLRVARLTKEQSVLNYQTAVANTVLDVELAYYDVLLAGQQIGVHEASVELLQRELTDTTRRFDAGTVPRFNVLRAEVELANERPKLIRARNDYRISKNNLANLLGFTVPRETLEDIPLNLSGKLEKEPFKIELPEAIATALERRTELMALRKAQALRNEDVINAKAGYKPTLQAYGGYDVHNSVFSPDVGVNVHGWITGVQMSWDIFDGWRTHGKVVEAQAQYERAGVDLDDNTRSIELQVRTAFSNFGEATEVLASQEKVVEQAEEALRLASARSEAGTGTQLDVLSAQTALTDARTTESVALHDYAAARARLERAVGMIIAPQPDQPASKN